MKNYLEKEMAKDELSFWNDVLEAQSNSTGRVERKYLYEILHRLKPKKVLDIGVGNGSFLIEIAKEFPNIQIVAIDHNQEFLNLAQERIVSEQINNIEIRNHYFDANGIHEDFDLIWSRYTLGHVSDKVSFLKGVKNSLSKGGYVLSLDGVFSFSKVSSFGIWKEIVGFYEQVFQKWGTDPDIGIHASRYMEEAGLKVEDHIIRMAHQGNCGFENFKNQIAKTLAMFHRQFPDIVSEKEALRIMNDFESVKVAPMPASIFLAQTLARR